jgi:hypothetical protein
MKIPEVLKKVNELQDLIGQKPPNLNEIIYQIIPAPNDDTFDSFFADYLYTGGINETIKLHRTKDFEILLIFRSKTGATYKNAWYNDCYKSSFLK